VAKEFSLPVYVVEAMPLPVFRQHVAFLQFEAKQRAKASGK
jgi:hypothetical protein